MPLGSAVVLMPKGARTATVRPCESVRPFESFTATINVNEPESIGDPARVPSEVKVSPTGRFPDFTDHE